MLARPRAGFAPTSAARSPAGAARPPASLAHVVDRAHDLLHDRLADVAAAKVRLLGRGNHAREHDRDQQDQRDVLDRPLAALGDRSHPEPAPQPRDLGVRPSHQRVANPRRLRLEPIHEPHLRHLRIPWTLLARVSGGARVGNRRECRARAQEGAWKASILAPAVPLGPLRGAGPDMSRLTSIFRRRGDETGPGQETEGQPAAASVAPTAPETPSFHDRGRLRRRLRYLRRVRELQLRDLGGLVYETHRMSRPRQDLVQRKVSALAATDAEMTGLEHALDDIRPLLELREPGIGGQCPRGGELFGSDARFCPRGGAGGAGEGGAAGGQPGGGGAPPGAAPAGAAAVPGAALATPGATPGGVPAGSPASPGAAPAGAPKLSRARP